MKIQLLIIASEHSYLDTLDKAASDYCDMLREYQALQGQEALEQCLEVLTLDFVAKCNREGRPLSVLFELPHIVLYNGFNEAQAHEALKQATGE